MKKMFFLSIIIGFMLNTPIWTMDEEKNRDVEVGVSNGDSEKKDPETVCYCCSSECSSNSGGNGCCYCGPNPDWSGYSEYDSLDTPFRIRCGKRICNFGHEISCCACCVCIIIGGVVYWVVA